ncbi:hypothetical protein AN958_10993 [Leucoagaricus sp. SymC.cos]|nr:hypothetical protein AN958_10993 [Leucoagaricus sp. SymC.cos]
MAAPTDLIFDLVKSDEISDALAIELEGFPLEEAADLEKFRFRQEQAPDLFLGAFVPKEGGKRKIIGYICSTLSSAKTLTHESMSTHIPASSTICIHSVCVEKSSRGKGIATRLLKEYVSRLRARVQTGSVPYERIALISHEELIPFYENGGFTNLGKSEVVHGSLPWYELQVELKDGADSATASKNAAPSLLSPVTGGVAEANQGNQQIPAGLWEALSRGSSRSNRPDGMLLSSFDKPMVSVTIEANQGTLVNKYDLLCPRPGCGSVILKEGVGEWVEKASEQVTLINCLIYKGMLKSP